MQYSENFKFNLPELTDNAIIEDINANFAVVDKNLACVPVENGGTGAKTAAEAREMLGITPENIGAQPKVTGAASTVAGNNLTATRALVSDSGGKIAVSDVTATELKYLNGVTSNVQTQLNGKATSSHTHDAGNITSGTLPIARGGTGNTTGQAASAVKLVTPRTIQTNLGSTSGASFNGTANITPGVTGILPIANGGSGAGTILEAQHNLGLAYVKTTGTAPNYKVEIAGITDLRPGVAARVVIHDELPDPKAATLNVNGLGAKPIGFYESDGYPSGSYNGEGALCLLENTPYEFAYNGSSWLCTTITKPIADLELVYGILSVENGGTGAETSAQARTNLGAAPAYIYSQTDLTAGVSALATGKLYFVYE